MTVIKIKMSELEKNNFNSAEELFKRLSSNKMGNPYKTNLAYFIINRFPKETWFTYQDIADTTGVNKTNINKYIRNLRDLGYIEVEKSRPVRFKVLKARKKIPGVFERADNISFRNDVFNEEEFQKALKRRGGGFRI